MTFFFTTLAVCGDRNGCFFRSNYCHRHRSRSFRLLNRIRWCWGSVWWYVLNVGNHNRNILRYQIILLNTMIPTHREKRPTRSVCCNCNNVVNCGNRGSNDLFGANIASSCVSVSNSAETYGSEHRIRTLRNVAQSVRF